jgi:hypothetical protein
MNGVSVSMSRRTRAAQLLGAAALTTAMVLGGSGAASAASGGVGSHGDAAIRPTSTQLQPLLADTGSRETGLLVIYSGLLVAAGGGALWALRRNEAAAAR